MDHQQAVNVTADAVSAAAILGTLAGLLPPLAAIAAILWYAVNIYESHTVQRWLRVRRRRRYRKHLRPKPDVEPPV